MLQIYDDDNILKTLAMVLLIIIIIIVMMEMNMMLKDGSVSGGRMNLEKDDKYFCFIHQDELSHTLRSTNG